MHIEKKNSAKKQKMNVIEQFTFFIMKKKYDINFSLRIFTKI